ncbi:MAG: signal peptidase II [Candidatus Andersenbacteria bacterium]|nr:signal peptidase II [Candidatus Andersenbacteria bacterium]
MLYKKAVLYFIFFLTSIRSIEAIARFFVDASNRNPGIAFALPVHALFLYALVFFASGSLAIILWRLNSRYFIAPIMLMLAAGGSNMIDRVIYGAVIDPISIGSWQGNVADIALCCGVFWIAWGMIKNRDVTRSHASTH